MRKGPRRRGFKEDVRHELKLLCSFVMALLLCTLSSDSCLLPSGQLAKLSEWLAYRRFQQNLKLPPEDVLRWPSPQLGLEAGKAPGVGSRGIAQPPQASCGWAGRLFGQACHRLLGAPEMTQLSGLWSRAGLKLTRAFAGSESEQVLSGVGELTGALLRVPRVPASMCEPRDLCREAQECSRFVLVPALDTGSSTRLFCSFQTH